ncbi:MAG: flagellar basal body-associated FliL family protein [Verrucomicrobia bacterium]|nr:flagellar basal body-associated FliL family protein [Verrucomicrobiota bacterium]
MSAPAKEAAKSGGDVPKLEGKPESATAAPPSGGIKALLPLILAVVLMPVLAYVMTMFVLLPKLQKAAGGGAAAEHATGTAAGEHSKAEAGAKPGESKGGEHGGGKEGGGDGKASVALSKAVTVNVAGSMGTRYIMANMTLVSTVNGFETKIKKNDDQLRALAGSVLRTKTISDLEKPGSINVITSELLTVFNNALGGNTVQEIYLTDFAIQ